MICTCIQNKTYAQIAALLDDPHTEMAEIRLDMCELSDDEIEELFGQSDVPLIATCRIASPGIGEAGCRRRLFAAIRAGARYADLEIEAPSALSKEFQQLCRDCGTEIIRSFHDFEGTPDDELLQRTLARCFRYGADIAKVVCTACGDEDTRRVEALYSLVIEGVESMQGRLVAFCMGEAGRASRLECLRRGAPFTYAATSPKEATAPGQWTAEEMYGRLYGEAGGADAKAARGASGYRCRYNASDLQMPASKSFAQRAILAAALARGSSHLSGYSPCGDTLAAIDLARSLGAEVRVEGSDISIRGIAATPGSLSLDSIFTGESGLLTRLSIPVMAAIGPGEFSVDGRGTLLRRPLDSAAAIMASFGVLLTGSGGHDGKEVFVPLTVKGHLLPGVAEVPGSGGSQLISGLLMALPLCSKDSSLHVSDPTSIPYMYMTLDVLKRFGVKTRSEMEGDAELLEESDWGACSGILFKIRGGQSYRSADFAIEGDWSAAANFLVAGAIFGSAGLRGLDSKSIQADISILDILVQAGAVVSELEDGSVCVRKAPLEAFEFDLNNAPDLFPIAALLAAFCSGESRIGGVGRLASKESDRAAAILGMLSQMGVEAEISGDVMSVWGESLSSRLLAGRLLHGGAYTSHHDHRMVMVLKVASLAADSPITIDDETCVSKSFPGFADLWSQTA